MRAFASIGFLLLIALPMAQAQGLSGGGFDGAAFAVATCGAAHSMRGGALDGAHMAVSTCGVAHNHRGSASDGSGFAVAPCGVVRAIRGSAFEGSGVAVRTCGVPRARSGGHCSGDHMNVRVCVGEVYVPSSCVSAALPVELLGFEALCQSEGTLLTWETGSEQGNAYFRIERAFGDAPWREVATVPGAGNSQHLLRYEWRDGLNDAPADAQRASTLYYRLSQVDNDGDSDEPVTTALAWPCAGGSNLTVVPVPAADALTVRASTEIDELQLVDAHGRTVLSLQPRSALVPLSVRELADGVYLLRARTGDRVESARVVVQH